MQTKIGEIYTMGARHDHFAPQGVIVRPNWVVAGEETVTICAMQEGVYCTEVLNLGNFDRFGNPLPGIAVLPKALYTLPVDLLAKKVGELTDEELTNLKRMIANAFELDLQQTPPVKEEVDMPPELQPVITTLAAISDPAPDPDLPRSMFPAEWLVENGSNLRVPKRIYSAEKRNVNTLTSKELASAQGNSSNEEMRMALEIYDRLEPIDALFWAPKLRTVALAEQLQVEPAVIRALKGICNRLRDMDDEEYTKRNAFEQKIVASNPKPGKEEKPVEVKPARNWDDTTDGDLLAIRNSCAAGSLDRLTNIDRKRLFLEVPKYKLKMWYRGKGFERAYQAAFKKYLEEVEAFDRCNDFMNK